MVIDMRIKLILWLCLFHTIDVMGQDAMSDDESKLASLYADYVSLKPFPKKCKEFLPDHNIGDLYDRWAKSRRNDLSKGYEVLKKHYKKSGTDKDEILSWKVEAEIAHFDQKTDVEKLESCKRIVSIFSA